MTPHPVVSMGDMNMFPSIIMFRGFVGNIVIYSSSSFDKLQKNTPHPIEGQRREMFLAKGGDWAVEKERRAGRPA